MSADTASRRTEFELYTGQFIPALALGGPGPDWGTSMLQVEDRAAAALQAGYRHINNLQITKTERAAVGRGIKKSGVPREDIFLTAKVDNNIRHPHDVEEALEGALLDLDTDYVDVFFLHWPAREYSGGYPVEPFPRYDPFPQQDHGGPSSGRMDFVNAYKTMEKLWNNGKMKAMGISNFSKRELERLLRETHITPAVHQIEMHPWLQQKDWAEFHREKGIHITHYWAYPNRAHWAYDPASDTPYLEAMIDTKVLDKIGEKHKVPSSLVPLAWGIAQGHSVIPNLNREPYADLDPVAQLQSDGLKLDEEDLQKIAHLDKNVRFIDRIIPK